ncbi:MAG: ATP-binding protein, partial [Hyphomicrobiales bacterium]
MIVYEADKKQFLHDNHADDIEEVIRRWFVAVTSRGVSAAELQSWKMSLGEMAKVLFDADIPDDVGVAVELHIPQSSKRMDITLTGRNAAGEKNAIIVELKQWDTASATTKDGIVTTYLGGARREVVHPSYQAWSYATLLEGFNEAVYAQGISIRPCAYLHNYVRDGVIDAAFYDGYLAKAPLFLRGEQERALLRNFIKTHVKLGDARSVLYELANGKIRPSKALADSLKGLMKSNDEFVLIDDQKEVFEAVLA